jgi:hypothetical protein
VMSAQDSIFKHWRGFKPTSNNNMTLKVEYRCVFTKETVQVFNAIAIGKEQRIHDCNVEVVALS